MIKKQFIFLRIMIFAAYSSFIVSTKFLKNKSVEAFKKISLFKLYKGNK